MKNELIHFNISVNQDKLIDYFYSLIQEDINETKVTHKQEFEKNYNYQISGVTVKDFKKELPFDTHIRKDLVSRCDVDHPIILDVVNHIKKKIPEAEIGLIAFFMQKKGEDVQLHRDFPYRKNSLLMIPLFGEEKYYIPKSNAITYYKDGGEYQILTPVIIDIMKLHGVKNIDQDRLMLHIEIPNLTIKEINEKYYD